VYKVELPELGPGEKISLVISTAYVDCLTPYPAIVKQAEKQFLLYTGEKYTPTLYTTMKQKTKIKYLHTESFVDVDYVGRLNRIRKGKQTLMENLIQQSQVVPSHTDPTIPNHQLLLPRKSRSTSNILHQSPL
jgi:Ribophorin I